jgi:5-methyltetrahydrofolate--homocysteine methyltransferase
MQEREALMARTGLRELLKQGTVVCDGGMGTQLMARGMTPGYCSEMWNVEHPEDVKAIHRDYRDAGCQLLTTNTFGGTYTSLAKHHHAELASKLNLAGAELARSEAGDNCLVMGDVGPFGDFLEPLGDTTVEQLTAAFMDQMMALKAGGADGIIVETMSDPAEIVTAVKAARQIGDWPVIATYAFAHGEGGTFRTMMGTSVDDAMKAIIDAGADVVGANCGTQLSLEDYLRLAQALVKAAGSTPVILQPNAGAPQTVDGKMVYLAKPEEMANLARRLVDVGVKVVGGCCGTNPGHLKAIAAAVRR